VLTLVLEGGEERKMRIAPRALAGAVLVEVGEGRERRQAWVDATLADMLVNTGLGAWRQISALGELGPEVSRVRLESAAGLLQLGRIQARWALVEPVSAPAEPDAIARLFSLAGKATVEDFLDGGPPDKTGLDAPAARMVIESDHRDATDAARVRTLRRVLEVGSTADVAGRRVFARLSGATVGRAGAEQEWSRVVIIDGQPLADIASDPAMYISKRTLATPAAEIGRIEILPPDQTAGVLLERGLDGWKLARAGGAASAATAADTAAIAQLLDLLTTTPAETVSLKAPDTLEAVGTFELQTVGGAPLAHVELGIGPDGRLCVGLQGVWRGYPATTGAPVIAWITGF
jgi:hypothetical protein